MTIKIRRVHKHSHVGECPECGKPFAFRARWRVEAEYEAHRLAKHPNLFDVVRQMSTAIQGVGQAVLRG